MTLEDSDSDAHTSVSVQALFSAARPIGWTISSVICLYVAQRDSRSQLNLNEPSSHAFLKYTSL
jgi:hypothetical protein